MTHEKFSTLASTATSQHGVLTFEQLRDDGLTISQVKYRVQTGELIRRPGQVFVVAGSAETWHQRAAVAALAAARHTRQACTDVGAVSHRAAARLFGFRTIDDDVDVSVQYPRRLCLDDARVIRSRDLVASDVTWVDGIPTTTPARTIVDLGLIFPEPEVMRILRHAVAVGLVNRLDVIRMRMRTSQHGRNGTGVAGRCLEALAELTEATESGLEAFFLEVCEQFGVPSPVLQLAVVANGRNYRLDFAYPTHKIFIEIDGAWHSESLQISRDGGRQNDLVAHGWQPIRLDYRQLKSDPEYCATIVLQVLASVNLTV